MKRVLAPLNIQESPQFRKIANSTPQHGTAGVMLKKPSKARAKNANQAMKRVACSAPTGESASKKLSTICSTVAAGLQLLPHLNSDQTMTAAEEDEEAISQLLQTDFDGNVLPEKSTVKKQHQQQHEQSNPVQYIEAEELLPHSQQQQEDNEDQQSQQMVQDKNEDEFGQKNILQTAEICSMSGEIPDSPASPDCPNTPIDDILTRTVDLTLDMKHAKIKLTPEQRALPMNVGPSFDCGGGFQTRTTQTTVRHTATGGTWRALEALIAKEYINGKTGKLGCFGISIPKNWVGNVARAINKLSMLMILMHRATSAKNATPIKVLHKSFLAAFEAYSHLSLESRDNIDLVTSDVMMKNGEKKVRNVGTNFSCGGGFNCFLMETTVCREGMAGEHAWTSYEIHIEKSYISKVGTPARFTMTLPAKHVSRVRLALNVHAMIIGEGEMLMLELEGV